MCDACGCGDTHLVSVDMHERLLAENDQVAAHTREHFIEQGVLAINLMGSPGSGKTAVLEATARALGSRRKLGAVSADLATDRDAIRLRKAGIVSEAITTGSACHLDASMVHEALHDLDWSDRDLFFIENVGNLVCPAIYDLGEAAKVVVLSVTEGVDKPLKYPVMFERADLVLISKIDLLPYLDDVNLAAIEDAIARVMPNALSIPISAKSGEGIDRWIEWLERRRPGLVPRPGDDGRSPPSNLRAW
jgi:hydrogenase nickel incorporation protein HypB